MTGDRLTKLRVPQAPWALLKAAPKGRQQQSQSSLEGGGVENRWHLVVTWGQACVRGPLGFYGGFWVDGGLRCQSGQGWVWGIWCSQEFHLGHSGQWLSNVFKVQNHFFKKGSQ